MQGGKYAFFSILELEKNGKIHKNIWKIWELSFISLTQIFFRFFSDSDFSYSNRKIMEKNLETKKANIAKITKKNILKKIGLDFSILDPAPLQLFISSSDVSYFPSSVLVASLWVIQPSPVHSRTVPDILIYYNSYIKGTSCPTVQYSAVSL